MSERPHELTKDCWCNPEVSVITADDEATYGEPRYQVEASTYYPTATDVVRVYEVKDYGPDKDGEPTLERRQILCLDAKDADDFTYALLQAGYGPQSYQDAVELDAEAS